MNKMGSKRPTIAQRFAGEKRSQWVGRGRSPRRSGVVKRGGRFKGNTQPEGGGNRKG